MISPFLAAAITVTLAAPLNAQLVATPGAGAVASATLVGVGDTVRAWARTPRLAGTPRRVMGATADSLSMGVSLRTSLRPADSAAVIPWTALTRLEVQRGSHVSGGAAFAGALFGTLGGALLGGLVGAMIPCQGECYQAAHGVFLGAAIGGVVGGALGTQAKSPTWEPVPLPPTRTTP